MKRSAARIAFALLAFAAPGARGEDQPAYDANAAFAESDQNADGAIEIDEFYDRLIDVFFLGDANKDGFLSEDEFLKVVVIKEDFAQIDRDADGKLSRREFVGARLPLFISIDTNKDGSLSITEVTAAYEGRSAK